MRPLLAFVLMVAATIGAAMASCASWLASDLCEYSCHGQGFTYVLVAVTVGSFVVTVRTLRWAVRETAAARRRRP